MMSRSPERISSYRRHFEDSSSSSYQVRVSSPSPVRRDAGRCRSASYTRSNAMAVSNSRAVGRRTISTSRSQPHLNGVGMGAICLSGGGPGADLDQAAAENREFLSTRTSEKQEMILLNDRLAAYIEKVRSLEQQNKLLETEIEVLQNRFLKPTGLRLLYEEQLKELMRLADQMRVQRDIAIAAKDAMAGQLEMIKVKYEEALEMRKKAELDIEAFRPDVDAATSARIALEKQLENLEVEIEFLRRVHKQEIEELMKQIYAAHASATDAYSLPDLSNALKQIQHQYDDIAAKNLQEMDSWYKNKFDDLNNKTSKHVDQVRHVREGIASAKKDIQNKERDMDSMNTKNEALEAQIRDTQDKYRKELEELQARIEALQLELKSSKQRTALLLREYQDLLNVKMSLEIEITTYRKLIEGEDSRLTSMVQSMQTMTLMSGSTSVHTVAAGVADRGGRGLAGGLGGDVGVGFAGGLGGPATGLGRGVGSGLDGSATVLGGSVGGGPTTVLGGHVDGGLATGLGGGVGRGPAIGLGGGVGSGPTTGFAEGVDGDPAKGLPGGVGGVPATGLAGGVGGDPAKGLPDVSSGPATGLAGGVGGDPAKGLPGGVSGGPATGLAAGVGGDPAKGLSGGVGGGPATGLAAGVGGDPAKGLSGGVGGGPVSALAGGIGGDPAKGLPGGVGGGPTTGLEGGVGDEHSKGLPGGVGGGPASGLVGGVGGDFAKGFEGTLTGSSATTLVGGTSSGLGAGTGIAGGFINGVTGGVSSIGTTVDYTQEQAVEMTERKTVLIRTIKTEDNILESSTQQKSYCISGAASEEE
ncbi:desmin [Danio aesculapii]|uniref:desmin n=1 Tax=Danio aesculapii TaxID=1142201 RepID=UPI0024BFA00F|nr:desmin [Danio aesculapii]